MTPELMRALAQVTNGLGLLGLLFLWAAYHVLPPSSELLPSTWLLVGLLGGVGSGLIGLSLYARYYAYRHRLAII